MDIVLLVFDVVVAIGLWLKQLWSVVSLVSGIIAFQIVPYTIFRKYFVETPEQLQTLNGLVGTEILLLAILLLLLLLRK